MQPGGMSGPVGGGPMQGTGGPAVLRNPVMLTLITYMCCPYYGLYQCMKMEEELNRFLGKPAGGNILWMLFAIIPILGMPKLMAEARAKAGTATQGEGSLLGYLFLWPYLLPKDTNEVWERLGVKPAP